MFRNAGKALAHNSIIPVGGSKDLKPLQDLITVEKQLLMSLQRLSLDLQKSNEALRAWGAGEGEDLGDTLGGSTTLLNHFASALSHYAGQEHEVRDIMKAIRTREENLDELKRRRRGVASRADSAEKKLSKMGPENKNLAVQTDILNGLRGEIRTMDTEIMLEEAALGDYKRKSAKEFMGLKFGGLAECCEKAFILSDMGKVLIQEIPQDTTEPGFARAPYGEHPKIQSTIADATHAIGQVVFSAQPLQNTGTRRAAEREPREPTMDSAESDYYRGGPPSETSWTPNPEQSAPPSLPNYIPSGHFIEPSDAPSTNPTQGWESSAPQSAPAQSPTSQSSFGHGPTTGATRSVDDLGVNLGPNAAPGGKSSRFATFPVKTRGTQLRDDPPTGSPSFMSITLNDTPDDSFSSSISEAFTSVQMEPNSPIVPPKIGYPSDIKTGDGIGGNDQAPAYAAGAGSSFGGPPAGPPPGAASPAMNSYSMDSYPTYSPYSPPSGYSGPPPPTSSSSGNGEPPQVSYNPAPLSPHYSATSPVPHTPAPAPPAELSPSTTSYGPPPGPPPPNAGAGLANPWDEVESKRLSRGSVNSDEDAGLAYMSGGASSDGGHAAAAPPPPHVAAAPAPPATFDLHSSLAHKLEDGNRERTSSESERHVRFGGVNDVNAELERRSQDHQHPSLPPQVEAPPPPPPPVVSVPAPPAEDHRSQRVAAPVYVDPDAEERALNAAAARQVSLELDALSFNAPPYARTPSPLLPPAPSFAHRAVSPRLTISTDDESTYASGSPTLNSPRTPKLNSPLPPPPHINLPPPASPTLSSANITPSPYRTPPEYPRSISAAKSSSSLASPTLPSGIPPATRTISAAAFRRPARLASGESRDSIIGVGGGGAIADTSPLSFKKRPLPSSPYPQRQTSYNTPAPAAEPSYVDSPLQQTTSGHSRRQQSEEDDDFDYIAAYANSHPEEAQEGAGKGYGGNNYSTNLDSGLR